MQLSYSHKQIHSIIPMKNINLYAIVLGTFLFAVSFIHTSCEETTSAKAEITVLDSLNRPVVGAIVELSQDSVINKSIYGCTSNYL